MKSVTTVLVLSLACIAGCASQRAYNEVFSEQTAIAGNTHSFAAAPADTLRAVVGTLVQRGFSIEQTDQQMGLVKATRNLQDPKDAKLSYLLTATASVWAAANGGGTVVRLSASEQQVTHSSKHNWVPIIGPLMIPMPGRTYQTTVTKEGTITDGGFYQDFFAAVQQTLAYETNPVTPTRSGPAPSVAATPAPSAAARAAPVPSQ
jgi:hypothetical protein